MRAARRVPAWNPADVNAIQPCDASLPRNSSANAAGATIETHVGASRHYASVMLQLHLEDIRARVAKAARSRLDTHVCMPSLQGRTRCVCLQSMRHAVFTA